VNDVPLGVWLTAAGIGATVAGWILKRVLWDPIAELKAAQATFVTEAEVEMRITELKGVIATLRTERADGEKQIRGDIENGRREQGLQRDEIRQDIRNLVRRIDTVMQNRTGNSARTD
jgi:hypothetical protein